MPHRTYREQHMLTGIREERFNRGNDAPCSACKQPFEPYERGHRLKEADGSAIRGYSRACNDCARAYVNSRLREESARQREEVAR